MYGTPKTSFVVADLILLRGRQQSCRTLTASPMLPPRSLRPQARLETFLTEAERPRRYPLLPGRRDPQAGTPSEKARRHKSDAHVAGESDSSIVPEKPARPASECPGWRAATRGVGGGKGTDRGEHGAIATGPDSAPELGRNPVRTQVARIARRTTSGTRGSEVEVHQLAAPPHAGTPAGEFLRFEEARRAGCRRRDVA